MQANQSRERLGHFDWKPQPLSTSATIFCYSPLEISVDSIRLVIIGPAAQFNAPIKCKLQHVTFAEIPKYEALSYTWGDESVKEKILINGKDFEVGPNLLYALQHLRDTQAERVVWIDAICINQSDVSERNRQLSIMPYIYQRAQTVLVSLRPYTEPQRTNVKDKGGLRSSGRGLRDEENNSKLTQNSLREACKNNYWSRVWIVQECSLARRIRVLFAGRVVEWKTFIAALREDGGFEDCVPLRLQRQIEQKYTDGHKLQTLLESHQDALCKEPRDKVYGFVGLAIDTLGDFPMDYKKSLYEVWKDTVLFKNADREVPQEDIVQFGRLVQNLLGGRQISTVEELTSDLIYRSRTPKIVTIPARIAGRISYIGPTYHEMISNLKQTTIWKANINKYFPSSQRVGAREECDQFLETLEQLEEEDLKKAASFTPAVTWRMPIEEKERKYRDVATIDEQYWNWPLVQSREKLFSDPDQVVYEPRDPPPGQYLFLLEARDDYSDAAPGKMGLAPPAARVGDFVCEVHGLDRAIIVRRTSGERLSMVGTAGLAENRYKVRAAKEKDEGPRKKFATAKCPSVPAPDRLDLFVDVAITYQLMDGHIGAESTGRI